MKKIFTLFTMLLFAVAASQAQGTYKPIVTPNPAHDYIKVNWTQAQSGNVSVVMYYLNGMPAKTLTNHVYGEGTYTEMYKITVPRGAYYVKVTVNGQMWSYKLLVQ